MAIKNQFREQGRLIAQEQVEKQRMERKMKAFESEVDALSKYVSTSIGTYWVPYFSIEGTFLI